MPSKRLRHEPEPVARFDVIGEDSHTALRPGFTRHLAVALEARDGVTSGTKVDVVHMCPPYENPGTIVAHAIGTVPLSADQQHRVDMFLDNIEPEFAALRLRVESDYKYALLSYIVCPHAKEECEASVDYHRFSCAGFVIEAYRFAGLRVIDTDEGSLPPVSRETVREAFGLERGVFENPRHRDRLEWLGLGERGDWPVVLPSYVLHALSRPEAEIKRGYRVRREDETFPHAAPE